jgi:integral membrane protein
MAFVVGTGLLLLCGAMVLKYVPAIDNPQPVTVVGTVHGFLFMIYVLTTMDLGFRLRWNLLPMLAVAVAGTIPFLSFYAEHRVVVWVREKEAARAAAAAPQTA